MVTPCRVLVLARTIFTFAVFAAAVLNFMGWLTHNVFQTRRLRVLLSGYGGHDIAESSIHFSPGLIGCSDASWRYFDEMKERGYGLDVVTSTSASGSTETSARLRYSEAFRVTSRNLPTKAKLKTKERTKLFTYWPKESLSTCPYWIEAARLRAVLEFGYTGRFTNQEGYGGAFARCEDDRDELLIRTETASRRDLTLPLKYCTWETCVQKDRPTCQNFIRSGSDSALPIFVYSAMVGDRLLGNKTFLTSSERVRQVTDPNDACLFVFDFAGFSRDLIHETFPGDKFALSNLPHWRDVDGVPGRNHIVVHPSCVTACDRPPIVDQVGKLGDALVVSPIFWDAVYRANFDITLPPFWRNSYKELNSKRQSRDSAQPNPLVFFRGTAAGNSKWETDRLLAAAFSHDPDKGIILQAAKRRHNRESGIQQCDTYSPNDDELASYDDMMARTLFAFCPGGSGPHSYRIMEALAAGAIPIVTEDLTLPFQEMTWYPVEELWKACAVVVSSGELYIMGDVVRDVVALGREAYEARAESCNKLWSEVMVGGIESPNKKGYEASSARMVAQELIFRLRG